MSLISSSSQDGQPQAVDLTLDAGRSYGRGRKLLRPGRVHLVRSDEPRRQNPKPSDQSGGDFRNLPAALEPLKALPLWCLWRWTWKEGSPTREGRWTKVPFQPSGKMASTSDAATFTTYDAVTIVARGYDGIGFLMHEHVAFDLDDCRDPATGKLHPWAEAKVKEAGSYAEVTPSGTGIRIIGTGTGADKGTKQPVVDGVSCEAYRRTNRYITITGAQLPSSPSGLADLDAVFDTTVAALAEQKGKGKPKGGGKVTETDLPKGVEAMLLASHKEMGYPSRSELLFAFLMMALRAGVDEEAIAAACLAGQYRGKDIYEHCSEGGGGSYVERQIEQAKEKIDRRNQQAALNIEIGEGITHEMLLPPILMEEEMHARLVFVGGSGAIVDRVTGMVRKREHALGQYAATAKNLRRWMRSPARITVEHLTWFPGQPAICKSPESPVAAFNTWRGLPPAPEPPPDWESRAAHFLDHIAYLVPVKEERERFVMWLAHIVQRPEELPHFAYLFVTPMTGIGRNLLASILVRVLRGYVAAGIDLPGILDGGFNGRLSEKLLATVDEAKEGSGERRWVRAEALKSLITTEVRKINPKYGVEKIEKNCCRWLMFSNHYDAIPIIENDRRIEVIANPTEPKGADYYERLYAMVDDPWFIASVRRLLDTTDISSFKPGRRVEPNEAKEKALEEGRTETEKAVRDFKAECNTDLTNREMIVAHVEAWGVKPINDTHLSRAITSAGMINTGRRVWGDDKHRFKVIIVKGPWTVEKVKKASPAELAGAGAFSM